VTPDREDAGRPHDLTPTLVHQLREGRQDAARLLDELYRNRLVSFCLHYLGNLEAAEDVVQDTFCKVLEAEAVPRNFRGWIYRICRNRCLDLRRAGARRTDETLPTGLYADLTGQLSKLVREEQAERLRELVARLPQEQREVLVLRYVQDLSRAEIAEVLGIEEKLVKSRLFHGLERLRLHDSLHADD
jgi:RNA polymerase sigma-70 factor (ECF subfamily)